MRLPNVAVMPPRDTEASPPNADDQGYRKLYLMLLDAIPCSVLLVDRSIRVASANRYFLEKSRRSEHATIGSDLEDVFPPGILEHVDIIKQLRDAFDSSLPLRGQRMTYRAPGVPTRFYYYSVLPVTDGPTCPAVYAMLVLEDVTEQVRLSEQIQRMERHLASVVENATDIILSTDTFGRIKTWNSAAETLSGYSPEEVDLRDLFEYLAPDARAEGQRAFAAMKGSNRPQMVYADLVTKHGERIPVSWVLSPMRGEHGEISGMAVGREMTGARKFEAQLLQSQKLAALGVMAGGIAHELRNPLTVCSSAAQFLMRDDSSAAFRLECAQQILSGIERASMVIENLLRFARPEPEIELVEVDLVSVVEDALAMVDNLAKLQRVEIASEAEQRPILCLANETLVTQVFINLFLNAIDAMPDGGRLSVSARKRESHASIDVTDSGCGISPQEIDKIFDPFYSRSLRGKGTGLGLSICYSVVKQLEGSIDVESDLGKGTRFSVTLPLAPARAGLAPERHAASRGKSPESENRGN